MDKHPLDLDRLMLALKPLGCGFVITGFSGETVSGEMLQALDDVTAEVRRIYLAEEARGRGIGRRLLGARALRARSGVQACPAHNRRRTTGGAPSLPIGRLRGDRAVHRRRVHDPLDGKTAGPAELIDHRTTPSRAPAESAEADRHSQQPAGQGLFHGTDEFRVAGGSEPRAVMIHGGRRP